MNARAAIVIVTVEIDGAGIDGNLGGAAGGEINVDIFAARNDVVCAFTRFDVDGRICFADDGNIISVAE